MILWLNFISLNLKLPTFLERDEVIAFLKYTFRHILFSGKPNFGLNNISVKVIFLKPNFSQFSLFFANLSVTAV